MQEALDDLVTLLALEPIEVNIFRGRSPDENRQRVFGGQVAGQALVAAARTVDDSSRLVHSLHAYFLRPGDPTVPILYEVDRLRDGRSFSTRRVVAIQHGRAIFNLQASFHAPEDGPDHQLPMPEGMPDPMSLPDWHTRMEPYKDQLGEWYDRPRPIDLRHVDGDPMTRKGTPSDSQRVWLRADGQLPEDPVVHACLVTYASDMTLLDTTVLPFGLSWDTPGMQMASLDHAMWFHRPFRADEWLLYDQHAISTGSARGLAGGALFAADGRLVVSVVQEGLARVGRVRRVMLALLVVGAVACADDDDLAEPEGTAPAATASATSAAAPTTSTAATSPPSTTTAASPATAPATTAPSETTTTVDPDVVPAVALTEVATLDGSVVDLAWRTGDDALYVVEQAGRVTRLAGDATATVLDITDLTDADGERGLLGLSFDPTGQFAYINYTDSDGSTVVSEHPVGDDGQFGTGDSSRLVLQIEQPYANHNGGDLTFGPDGMLYIGMGDGGSGGDPERRATDMTTLLGKLLRIDPAAAGGEPYVIPADNPFVPDGDVSPEIWASGLRNPWRFSFDRETGDLWIADVGQNAVEEIDVAPATGGLDAGKGLSFGWSAFEGDERFNDDVPAEGHVPPIATYGHDVGCSISGGVRVRGGPVPALVGWYVYADYCSGQVWALQVTGDGAEMAAGRNIELGQVESATAVVDGPGGETYVLSANGTVYRLDPA